LSIHAIKGTKCKEFEVRNYEYNKFYDLTEIQNAQSEDFFIKLPITLESYHGDIHIIFSESTDTTNINRAYEFLLGGYGNTVCEIRRKDYLREKRDFNGNRFADYSIPTYSEFNVELSISKHGVIKMEHLETHFQFNLTDQLPVVSVKYVAFAGYRGSRTQVTFDCVDIEIFESTPVVTSTEVTTEIATETEIPTSTDEITTPIIDSIIDNEIETNEVISKAEEPIELTTSVASALV